MRVYQRLPRGVRRIFRLPGTNGRLMGELDDEIRFHIETRIDALRAEGMSYDEARTAALTRFGDAEDLRRHYRGMAETRAQRAGVAEWWSEWMQDVRFAVRQFARAPGFAAITVVMLALGIGANTALFSVVHHAILAPLPFPDGNRIVTFTAMGGGGRIRISPMQRMVENWRQRTHDVDRVALAQEGFRLLGDSTGRSEEVGSMTVQPQIFAIAPVTPILGRNIVGADTLAGAAPVAVIGYGLWVRDFGQSTNVLGRVIHANDGSYTIVGVMPPGYFVPFASDMNQIFTALQSSSSDRPIFAIGMLRRGVSADAANRELAALFPPRSADNPDTDPPRVMSTTDLTSKSFRDMVFILFAAVSCVLLIACANVANLSLARSWSRQREFAIRAALGAGRARLSRQVFTESLLLALSGGALGIGTAFAGLRIIVAAQPSGASALEGVHIEPMVLAWAFTISILAALVFGIAPALFAANDRSGETLKSGVRTASGSPGARRFRSTLVVVEVALSVVLLVGAGLLLRTLVAFERLDVGMHPHGLIGLQLQQLQPRLTVDATRRTAEYSAVLAAVRAVPGVQAATYSRGGVPPDFGMAMGRLEIEGQQSDSRDSLNLLGFNSVSPDFFAIAGIPLRRGRLFATDASAHGGAASDEVVINEKFAQRFWPSGNALGARFRRGAGPWSTVVGIVGDVRLPSLDERGKDLQMYEPIELDAPALALVVRSTLPLAALTKTLTKVIHDADPSLVVRGTPVTADALVSRSMEGQRFVFALLGAFAVLALALAAIGLHSVVAYSVGQRTREIGVRVALGAQRADVLRLVVAQGLVLVLVGVVVGAGAALGATRALGRLLYGVSPSDPVTLLAVSLALVLVSLVASYGPARRAAGLDPVDALRAE